MVSSRNRITMYMRDGKNASSSYYRLLQYVDDLSEALDCRITVRVLVGNRAVSLRYDVSGGQVPVIKKAASKIWYNISLYIRGVAYMLIDVFSPPTCLIVLRSLYPKYCGFPFNRLYSALLNRCDGVIWDFDDDIFEIKEISRVEVDLLLAASDKITVTHADLRALLPVSQRDKVVLVPTTDGDVSGDITILNKMRSESYASEIRMVWVASSSSLDYLEHVASVLDEAALEVEQRFSKRLTLHVVCNRPLDHTFRRLEVTFVKWSRDIALKELERAHIGIMPVDNTKFAKGKGGFKAVQYMAAGLPAIASSVGFNTEVLADGETGFLVITPEDWIKGIVRLSGDYTYWESMSQAARCRWDQLFSYERNLRLLTATVSEAIRE